MLTRVLLLLIVAIGGLKAQSDSAIVLDSVIIDVPVSLTYQSDQQVIAVNSLPTNNALNPVQNALAEASTVGVKIYGAEGAISTLSISGLSSSHAQVLWNGFNINSTTLGSFDLGLIQQSSFDQMTLDLSPSSSANGSGAISGVLNVSSKPQFGEKNSLSIGLESGWYDQRGLSLENKLGFNKKGILQGAWNTVNTSTQLSLQYVDAPNYFAIINEKKQGSPIERVENSELVNQNISLTHHHLLADKWLVAGGINYVKKHKNSPSITQFQTQEGENFRSFVSIKRVAKKWSLNYRSAFIHDVLNYLSITQQTLDTLIQSNIVVGAWKNSINGNYKLNSSWFLDGAYIHEQFFPEVSSYPSELKEYNDQLFVGLKRQSKHWLFRPSYRLYWYNNYQPKQVAGLRLGYVKKRWKGEVTLDQKYRVPTLNDRYWIPGGVRDLQPEEGWGSGGSLIYSIGSDQKSLIQLNYRFNRIQNWIQWVPGEGYWYPTSHMEVDNQSLDFLMQFSNTLKSAEISNQAMVSVFDTRIIKVKDHPDFEPVMMPYVPRYAINYNLQFKIKSVSLNYIMDYEGKRYTDNSNNEVFALDPVLLLHIMCSTEIKVFKKHELTAYCKVNNLLNLNYQMVRNYYVPGRYIKLGTNLKLK